MQVGDRCFQRFRRGLVRALHYDASKKRGSDAHIGERMERDGSFDGQKLLRFGL